MDPSPNEHPAPVEEDPGALRIQIASVAAQQTALLLEEDKLRQRAAALERQEAQLASHLEERRDRLLELQEQVRQEREALKAERAAFEAERKDQLGRLAQERADAAAAAESARHERTRLLALRRRLWQRSRQQTRARETDLARAERQLGQDRMSLARGVERLRSDRQAFARTQMRINGELQMGRRLLDEGWRELSLTQQEWDVCLNNELALHERRAHDLRERAAAVAAGEKALGDAERFWQRRQAELSSEVAGLEQRVANLRRQLPGPEQEFYLPAAVTPGSGGISVVPSDAADVPETIERIAADLADQRRHLLEQWQRLLAVQDRWEGERSAFLAELEEAAVRLDERESSLDDRSAALESERQSLNGTREALERDRSNVQGWRTRLAAREIAFESEREAAANAIRVREQVLAGENRRLIDLRQRWGERRRQELSEMQTLRVRCQETRSAYLRLWKETRERRARLAEAHRELAARETAQEHLRGELLGRAADAAAAERRLVRLEQRERQRIRSREGELSKADRALQSEIARLEAAWKQFETAESDLTTRQEALAQSNEDRKHAESLARSQEDQRRAEMHLLQLRHDEDTRALEALREELEGIARQLIGDESALHSLEERSAA